MTDPKPARKRAEEGALYATEFELRAGTDGGGPVFEGYAALFDVESDAPWLPFKEVIRPGAFSNSLRAGANHNFVLNHNDDILFASTRTGRLRLAEDKRGLLNIASLPDTAAAHDLKALYDVGEVRGMSFSFKPTRGGIRAYGDNGRELHDLKLGHTTVITTLTPGYSQTGETLVIRALADDLSADPDDLDGLLDGLRAGRPLHPDEIDLLHRLASHFRADSEPEGEPVGRSVASWKALLKTKGITFRSDAPGARPGDLSDEAQPVAGDQSPTDDEPVIPEGDTP